MSREIAHDRSPFRTAVALELAGARVNHPPLNSLHEAYAVIAEEVDELWEEVRKKRCDRRPASVLTELIQIAAMAERAAIDLGLIDA